MRYTIVVIEDGELVDVFKTTSKPKGTNVETILTENTHCVSPTRISYEFFQSSGTEFYEFDAEDGREWIVNVIDNQFIKTV